MANDANPPPDLTVEHRILIQMRQVLARVVRDVTPPPGMPNPLPLSTIEQIRECFGLIAARERELNAERKNIDLPVFNDPAASTQIVDFKPGKKPRDRQD